MVLDDDEVDLLDEMVDADDEIETDEMPLIMVDDDEVECEVVEDADVNEYLYYVIHHLVGIT